MHLIQPPAIGRQRLHLDGLFPIPPLLPACVRVIAVIVRLSGSDALSEPERRLGPSPACALPLGLRGQAQRQRREALVEAADEVQGFIPAHVLHRPLGPLESARVLAHHRLPQRLRAGGLGQPEAPRQYHLVLALVGFSLRLGVGRAHQEPPRRDPAHALGHALDAEVRIESVAVYAHGARPIRLTEALAPQRLELRLIEEAAPGEAQGPDLCTAVVQDGIGARIEPVCPARALTLANVDEQALPIPAHGTGPGRPGHRLDAQGVVVGLDNEAAVFRQREKRSRLQSCERYRAPATCLGGGTRFVQSLQHGRRSAKFGDEAPVQWVPDDRRRFDLQRLAPLA